MLCLASDATGVRVLGGCVNYGTKSVVAVIAVAAAAEVGGCSCRDCGGGSWWLFLPWLRRRQCVDEGVGTRGWMPPQQLVATVPRWSRDVVALERAAVACGWPLFRDFFAKFRPFFEEKNREIGNLAKYSAADRAQLISPFFLGLTKFKRKISDHQSTTKISKFRQNRSKF